MMNRNLWILSLITAMTIGVLPSAIALTFPDNVPQVIRPCIPETVARYRIDRPELVAKTTYQAIDYYLLTFYPVVNPGSQFTAQQLSFPVVISTKGKACQVAYANPTNDDYPLSDSEEVPAAVAQQFDPLMGDSGNGE
jgi:hypothetical protein